MSRVHPPHNPSPHCHRNNQSHFKAKYTEQQIIILVRQKTPQTLMDKTVTNRDD